MTRYRTISAATGPLLSLGIFLGASTLAGLASAADPIAQVTSTSSEATPKRKRTIWTAGVRDAEHPGRWQREFERRKRLAQAAGRGPQGALALLGLLGNLEGELPLSTLDGFLTELSEHKGRDPEVRSLANYLRARLYEDSGRKDEGIKLLEAEGYLTRFMLLGPFDRNKDGSIDDPLAPESEPFDAQQSFEGKLPKEALAWHPHGPQDALSGGYVSLDEFLFPNVEVVGYASTYVFVPDARGIITAKGPASAKLLKPRKVLLHVGSGGPYRAFLDGKKLGGSDAKRSPDALQDSYAVELTPGWHRVLFKLGADEGVWGVYARVSALDGSPISGLHHQARTPAAGVGAKREPTIVSGRFGLRARLEARAKGKGRAKAKAKLELAEFYRWVRPFDADDPVDLATARDAEAELKSVRAAMLVGALSRDSNDARDALERAIARAQSVTTKSAHPLLGDLLLELFWRYQALGLEARARETLELARAAAPDDALIEMTAVEELSEDGFTLAALAWVEDLRARYPDSATVTRAYAGRLMDLGRVREGIKLLEHLQDAGLADGSVAHALIRAHLALGEVDKARTIGKRIVAAAPGRPRVYQELAELYEAEEDYDAAIVAIERALERAPQDAELHRRKGQLLARAGQRDASILAFSRSLELHPQQPDIQDLLASYGADESADIFATQGLDLEAEVASLQKQGEPANWRGKEAGVVRHLIAQRVFDNGLGERLDHRIIKVLDDRGVRSQSVQAFTFDPAESYVEVRRARVKRANGNVEELGESAAYSLAAAGYRMYYDQRQLRVTFQGLRVGDVLEVAFVRRDVAARNMFDDYYGDLVPLEDSVPMARFDYSLEAPSDMKLFFNQQVERQSDESRVQYRLSRANVAAVKPEGNMPGWTEVLEHLHVSTYGDWDAVARWYWGLVSEQLIVGPEIKKGVQEALATLGKDPSERQKVDAIYRHVIRSTRYVGLEFGIHGYKPYKTTDVYARRFGDCKDKASLLKVMLAEVGVTAHLVLVRTRDQGEIGATPASLSAFNHAIVYVPKYDLFLDGTAEWSGADELPAGDQGASVLIVQDGKGGRFTQIPISKPTDNETKLKEVVQLSADGSADVRHDMWLRGAGASSWRARFQSQDEQLEVLTKQVGAKLQGTVVSEVKFDAIGDPLSPVKLQQRLMVPSWAKQSGGPGGAGLSFRVNGRESSLVRRFAPMAKRDHDLVLTVPTQETREMEYRLPKGYEFSRLPESREVQSKHGRFRLSVEQADVGARVSTQFELRSYRIPAADYKEFREFLRQVDAAMEQSFEMGEAQ